MKTELLIDPSGCHTFKCLWCGTLAWDAGFPDGCPDQRAVMTAISGIRITKSHFVRVRRSFLGWLLRAPKIIQQVDDERVPFTELRPYHKYECLPDVCGDPTCFEYHGPSRQFCPKHSNDEPSEKVFGLGAIKVGWSVKATQIAILILLAQLPPTYVYRSAPNVDVHIKEDGKESAPIYIQPLPNPDLTPQYQIVQPGTNRPPAYIVPESDGSVEIIRPGRTAHDDDEESPVK